MVKYGYSISNNKNKAVEIVFSVQDIEGYIQFNFSKYCPDLIKRTNVERRCEGQEIIYSLPYSDLIFKVTHCKIIYVRSISEWGRS
jgi:hypothetical protein